MAIQCEALGRYTVRCHNQTLHPSKRCKVHREIEAANRARQQKRPANWRTWLPDGRQALADILLMCCYVVPLNVISRWNDEQRADANKWASKYYLRASDNLVRVPERPAFLDGYEETAVGRSRRLRATMNALNRVN